MNKYIIIAIVVVIALVIATVVRYLKKQQYQKMLTALQQGNFKEFNELVNSKLSSFLYSSLYLATLQLESAYLRNNKKEIAELLDKILGSKINDKQRDQIISRAFNYYIALEDKENSRKYLDMIQATNNLRMKQECERVYDVYIEKGYQFLDEVLDETGQLDEENRGVNEYLISLMYQNKNDLENAKKYRELSEKHLAEFDESHKKD